MNSKYSLLLREDEPTSTFVYIEPPFDFNAPEVSKYPVEVTGYYLIKWMCRRLGWPSLADKRLLDFGCGVRFARSIVNLGLDVGFYAGVDTNPAPIAWLNDTLTDHRLAFHHINMRNEMYNPTGDVLDDASLVGIGLVDFDAASMFSVITHQSPEDAETIFAMLHRSVRSGGQLYFTAFADESTERYDERDPAMACHLSTYNPDVLIDILDRTGWRTLDIYRPADLQQTAFVCEKSKRRR